MMGKAKDYCYCMKNSAMKTNASIENLVETFPAFSLPNVF